MALRDVLVCLAEQPNEPGGALLRQILDSIHVAVLVIDRDTTIVYTNPAYQRLLSVPGARTLGRKVADLDPNALIVQVLRTGKPRLQQVTRIQSLDQFHCFGDAFPLYEGKRLVGAAAVFHNLDEMSKVQPMGPVGRKQRDTAPSRINKPISNSPVMIQVLERARKVARVDSTVLITGESGVGKQVVAEYIHRHGHRSHGPFIPVNCGAIPGDLLESELFGYRPGAFTGAMREGKPGLVAAAEGGTLFLDEVGDMPAHLQVKLLRVLQEREYTPLGAVGPVKADIRVLAATNRDLPAMVRQQQFREDLFYRLNVIQLHIPPLRQRVQEIRPLAEAFLHHLRRRYGLVRHLSAEVVTWLEEYGWPGNVRELENTVERLAVLADGDTITLNDLTESVPAAARPAEGRGQSLASGSLLRESVEQTERELIVGALRLQGSARRAAAYLGVDPATLLRKARRHNIPLHA